jgi:hypothetical protein
MLAKIQQNERIVNISKRFMNIGFGLYNRLSKSSDKHIFVTASNTIYFKQLFRLVESIQRYETDLIILYDLGLDPEELNRLSELSNISVRKFNFQQYPDHFDLSKYPYGSFAWKIALIHETFHEFKCDLTYLDAKNLVIDKFSVSRFYLNHYGFYMPYSAGEIIKWTHPATFAYFKNQSLGEKKPLNGSYFSISFRNERVVELINEWFELAFEKDIIAPEGASKENHRYDQSLLSCLFHNAFNFDKLPYSATRIFNVITHYDNKVSRKFKRLDRLKK